jgi:hypothetical protein
MRRGYTREAYLALVSEETFSKLLQARMMKELTIRLAYRRDRWSVRGA